MLMVKSEAVSRDDGWGQKVTHHQDNVEQKVSQSQQVPNDYEITKFYGVLEVAKDKSIA